MDVTIGDSNAAQIGMGVFVTEIRPMTIYDSVVAHLSNFRHPYVTELEADDNKKFFRE